MRSPMADDGLRSLGEKPIWEGVLLYLDAMDTVCLRTVSMEWNMPGKCGPHGVLLFFLIQKKPAIVPATILSTSSVQGWEESLVSEATESSSVQHTHTFHIIRPVMGGVTCLGGS